MSNKIIDSLLNGNLAATGSVSFDNTQPCYLVEYADGSVGVYSIMPKVTFYNYVHYELKDGSVIQSVHKPKNFFLDKSINDFFNSIITNNYAIAQSASSKIATVTALDPRYIVNLYYYNPKAQVTLETIDMSKWTLTDEQKSQWSVATTYFTSITNKAKVASDTASLISTLASFITNLIMTNQKAKTNVWTTSGMLVLEINQTLINQVSILASYNALCAEIKSFNLGTPPSLSDIISNAVASTTWVLGRLVDLTVSPFIYLYPKGANMPALIPPAVAPTDPSVKVITPVTTTTDTPTPAPASTTTSTTTSTVTPTPTTETTTTSTETPAKTS